MTCDFLDGHLVQLRPTEGPYVLWFRILYRKQSKDTYSK